MLGLALSLTPTGVLLVVKARPSAKREREARLVDIGDGKVAIEISVAAVAVDGKANKAILAAVAEGLGVKLSAVTLKSGATGRNKFVAVSGDPTMLASRAAAWVL